MTYEHEEPIVAYLCGGEFGPDFAALAAAGCSAVVIDASAAWYHDGLVSEARAYGLIAVAISPTPRVPNVS